MSETKFSPLPWSSIDRPGGTKVIFSEGRHWALCELSAQTGCTDPAEDILADEAGANAHLIAAAPELYEALYELTDLVDALVSGEYRPDSFTTQPAHAALKKARGET